MSKPIVQIKRGQAQQLGKSVRFTQPLLNGELCDIYYTGNNVHKLFIGEGSTTPSLLNPDYMFRITQDKDKDKGVITQITLYRETRNPATDQIVYVVQSNSEFIIPPAGADEAFGLITNGNQIIAGDKTFTNSILPGNNSASIGGPSQQWNNIFATSFTGTLNGNASSASKLKESVLINNTSFDGSTGITTAIWGTERNVVISDTASSTAANGTTINGSTNYTLSIPDTMTGFASITTTTLLPTNSTGSALGSSSNIWTNFYTKNPYIYNDSGTRYTKLYTDLTTTNSNVTLTLPGESGELVYHSDNVKIGDTTAPVYVTASGAVTACTQIDVAHGGTGVNTIASNGIVIGKGTNAIATIAPVAAGSILVSDGINAAPKYATPTLTWSAGNASTAPQISFNLNSQSTSVALPFATGSANGVVSTDTQTFAGAKTFSGALTASSTLGVTGKLTAHGGAEIKNNLIATSIISSTNSTKSSITLSDNTISMLSTQINLDGKIILTNDSYGTSFPPSPVEGQIFFLIG